MKQFQAAPQRYSYTLYDDLGRVTEAGEVAEASIPLKSIFGAIVQGAEQPFTIDQENLNAWLDVLPDANRTEVTRTFYDAPLGASYEAHFTSNSQDHLRLRVAATIFQEQYDPDPTNYDHASHYSYDIHGNVKELLQDHPQLGEDCAECEDAHFKHLKYTYDLISGNVRQVSYQAGKADQFHHRYAYDADNRIARVETSRNGIVWREDARYFYYPHGPLQRVELGEHLVQGTDYAYTLQGWLKGINSTLLTPHHDLGLDAAYDVQDNPNALIGRDVFGLTLGYYGDADYEAIDVARWSTAATRPFALVGSTGTLSNEHRPLYNGNIAHTVHSLSPFAGYPDDPVAPGQVLAMVYKYDQLNRLKQARGIVGLTTTNHWQDVDDDADPDRYKSEYWYDANGNIDTLARFDNDGNQYDGLGYRYHLDENDRKVRNRLYQVRELADQSDQYANDVSDLPYLDEEIQDPTGQGDPDLGQNINQLNNYSYDAIGNLIKDRNEEIDNILWTVAGKVKAVDRPSSSGKNNLLFAYGAGGQRIVKEVQDDAGVPLYRDHYVRDAQGNVMAMYRHTIGEGSLKVTERPLYGSNRLGTDAYELELGGEPPYDELDDPTGLLRYELTDHLGNVMAVITDELFGVDVDADEEVDYFQPYLLSAQGYEPFGSLLPGRNYSSDSYAHGFNGMRKDDEIHGATGTSYDFGERIYDPRIGRWLSLDPIADKYPGYSPYAFCVNNPIIFVDLGGLRVVLAEGLTPEETARAEAAIKLVQERQPEFYAYLQTLRYNPAVNGGAFLSPGDEGYDSEEAFDVIITVGIKDIDGVPRAKEMRDRFDPSTKLSTAAHYDLQGKQGLVKGNAGYGGGLEVDREAQTVSVWAKGNTDSKTTISTVEQSQTTELAFGILRLSNNSGPHFWVALDDFIGGGAALDGEVLSHEFGHVEGDIRFQLNAAFFGTTGRQTQGGHEPGNLGGQNAERRAKEFVDAGKQ